MTGNPRWTLDEFKALAAYHGLDDQDVARLVPGRSSGAIGIVRAGLHSYHRDQDLSMLSQIMLEELDLHPGRYTCPKCGDKLAR